VALFLVKTQTTPALKFGVVPWGIISCIATIPCDVLFSYPRKYLHCTKWSSDTHIALIGSPILKKFNAMDLACHFLHFYHLDFYLKKQLWLSNSKKLWSNKFLKEPPCRIFWKIKMTSISYKTLDSETRLLDLTILMLWHIVGLSI
jgi:hypothetical protein